MTDLYRCTNQHHNGDICIGFCLNENCQYPSLICFQCMRDQHFNHQNDCQGFVTMQKWLGKMLDDQRNVVDSLKNTLQELIEQQQIIHKKHKLLYDKCLIFKQNLYENNYNFFQENISDIKFLYSNQSRFISQSQQIQVIREQCEILRQLLLNLDNIQPLVQFDNIIRIEQGQFIQSFQKDLLPPSFQYPQQFNQQYSDQNLQYQQMSLPQKYPNCFTCPIMYQKTQQSVQQLSIDTNQQQFYYQQQVQPQLIKDPQYQKVSVHTLPDQPSNQKEQIQMTQSANQQNKRKIIIYGEFI